jgi:hypothetical protein
MIRRRVLTGLILAGMITVVALVWMGQPVGGSSRACLLYPHTSGCR